MMIFDVGISGIYLGRQLQAVHIGRFHVGKQDVHRVGVQQLQGALSIGSLESIQREGQLFNEEADA